MMVVVVVVVSSYCVIYVLISNITIVCFLWTCMHQAPSIKKG